jgi:hypothetical protein
MRRFCSVFVILLLASFAAAQPAYRHHMLVRVLPESPERMMELFRYTNLDLIPGDGPLQPHLNAYPEDLTFLQFHGYSYVVLQEDVEKYYAERLTSSPLMLMGGYKTYAEIVTELDNIHTAHPTITTAKFSIGNSLEGRAMWVIKISDNPDVDEDEPEVFYNSLIHCREPEGMEALFYFVHYLTDNYGTNADVTNLVNSREIYFLPCVNPDGYEYNRSTNPSGGGQWRKNRRNNGDGSYGVDLNRNFGVDWGIDNSGSSNVPSDETYRGPSAFSEPETQNIRAFVNSRHFAVEEDCHTYGDYLLIPWSTSYSGNDGTGLTPDNTTLKMMIDSMNYFIHSVNGVWYSAGPAWRILYSVNGGSFDWEYGAQTEHLKVFAMSTEIGNSSDGFWPSTSRITPLAQENLPAFLFLARIAGRLAPPSYQVAYNGQCQSEVSGNGNGATDPGETLSLTVNLNNRGLSTLSGLSGTITTSDPYATVIVGTSAWPTIASLQTASNSTPFNVTIAGNCPTPRYVSLSLHLTAGGLDTTLSVQATVGRSSLADNVEGGVGGWTTAGRPNLWHISTRRSNSATHSWFCGNESGNYYDTTGCTLQTTLILGPGAEISYDQWYSFESGYDFGYFEMNTGSGWTNVGTRVTGASGGWVHTTQTLSIPCAGSIVQIRFRMSSEEGGTAEGWYIDNIQTGCAGVSDIAINPTSVTGNAPLSGTDTRTIQICNQGACPLRWTAAFTQTTPLTTGVANAADASMIQIPFVIPVSDPNLSKTAADRVQGRDQLDNHGGPDAYGYRWADSNEPGGPTYNWVELSGIGTALSYTSDDQVLSVTLPWSFSFYGTSYTTANVSADGNIHFGTLTSAYNNVTIPSASTPNAMLAVFWDDLSPQLTGAHVWRYNDVSNGRYIVQWDSVPHYSGSGTTGNYTFEIILYNDGRIVYQYQRLTGALNSCTVGIENAAGNVGLQVVYNAAYLTNNLAILFSLTPPWLTFGSPASDTLNNGECTNLVLNFTAGTLALGTYTGNVTLTSNDPDENPLVVPIIFQVGQYPVPQEAMLYFLPETNQLRLSWHSTGAPRYVIHMDTTVAGSFNMLPDTTTDTTLTIPLPANKRQFFIVKSSN